MCALETVVREFLATPRIAVAGVSRDPQQAANLVYRKLKASGHTELSIYDLSGRRVASVRGAAGATLVWDGRSQSGALAHPGLYLYELSVGPHRQRGKVAILR